jgi:hypothetical protein
MVDLTNARAAASLPDLSLSEGFGMMLAGQVIPTLTDQYKRQPSTGGMQSACNSIDGPGCIEARDQYIAARVENAYSHIWYWTGQATMVVTAGMDGLGTIGTLSAAGRTMTSTTATSIGPSATAAAPPVSTEPATYYTGRQSLGAAAATGRSGVKGLLKDAGLPHTGRIRFVPEPHAANTGLRTAPQGGFVDRFGNVWQRPRGHIVGEPHWDVQLSAEGRAKLGWASRSGNHLNVSNDGRIVH